MTTIRATFIIDTDVEEGEDEVAVAQSVAIDLICSGLEPVTIERS